MLADITAAGYLSLYPQLDSALFNPWAVVMLFPPLNHYNEQHMFFGYVVGFNKTEHYADFVCQCFYYK